MRRQGHPPHKNTYYRIVVDQSPVMHTLHQQRRGRRRQRDKRHHHHQQRASGGDDGDDAGGEPLHQRSRRGPPAEEADLRPYGVCEGRRWRSNSSMGKSKKNKRRRRNSRGGTSNSNSSSINNQTNTRGNHCDRIGVQQGPPVVAPAPTSSRSRKNKDRKKRPPISAGGGNSAMDDIEAQLKAQRLKQQQQQQQQREQDAVDDEAEARFRDWRDDRKLPAAQVSAAKGKQRLGAFEYCEERRAYFPVGQQERYFQQQEASSRQRQQSPNTATTTRYETPPFDSRTTGAGGRGHCYRDYPYLASICGSSTQRQAVVTRWRCRQLLGRMVRTPSCVEADHGAGRNEGWKMLMRTYYGFGDPRRPRAGRSEHSECSSDALCKCDLPPWCRTFDVAPTWQPPTSTESSEDVGDGEASRDMTDQIPSPVIATLAYPREALLRMVNTGRQRETRTYPLFGERRVGAYDAPQIEKTTIRMEADGSLLTVGIVEADSESSSTLSFFSNRTDHGDERYPQNELTKVNVPFPVNDFDVARNLKVWLAGCIGGRRSRVPGTCYAYLEADAIFTTKNPRLPVSSTTAVQCIPGNGNDVTSKMSDLALFGHLNGQLSVIDERDGKASVPFVTNEDRTFGNVTRLKALDGHGPPSHQVLARGSNGTCRLYDLRKSSSPSTNTTFGMMDPSVVHEFRLYPTTFNKLYTGKCNGVATDPSETVVMAPFSDADMLPRLGVWSIDTGEYMGSESLIPSTDAMSKADPDRAIHEMKGAIVELNETITAAWSWSGNGHGDDNSVSQRSSKDDGDHRGIVHVPGSFGLWYKLANPASAGGMLMNIPSVAGNIHHVHFPDGIGLDK